MNHQALKRRTDLIELVRESLLNGPVPLSLYAQIVQCDSSDPASWERSARRLVKLLRGLKLKVETKGDAERLCIDFTKARSWAPIRMKFPEFKAVSPPLSKPERRRARRITPEQLESRIMVRLGPALDSLEALESGLEALRSILWP